jgi:hypothetical protein
MLWLESAKVGKENGIKQNPLLKLHGSEATWKVQEQEYLQEQAELIKSAKKKKRKLSQDQDLSQLQSNHVKAVEDRRRTSLFNIS